MNIAMIKTELSNKLGFPIAHLTMVRQLNEQNQPEPWLSHWDNDRRVRITMHEEVFQTILAKPTQIGLAYKLETVPAKGELGSDDYRASYIRAVIITPKNIEGVL